MKNRTLATYDGFDGIEDSPVSMATVGASIGLFLGPAGLIVGALIGGIADVFIGARAKEKARKKMKQAFYAMLLKRYNNQVFISALERMGPAMEHLSSLGLKPGTPQYDQMLVRKVGKEIGYKGKCEIDLYGVAPPGAPRPLIATINRYGKIVPHNPNVDYAMGGKWADACRELHKAALTSWAEDQKENILLERELREEKESAQRNAVTRILVNAGLIMLMLGYTLRQKRKVKQIRTYKKKKAAEKASQKKSTEETAQKR